MNGYGRVVPYGGTLELPAGKWGRLPNAPAPRTGGWPVNAIDGPRIAAEGWIYDDTTGTWTKVPQPSGAPKFPGAAVWAGDELIVLGGYTGYSASDLSNQAFSFQS